MIYTLDNVHFRSYLSKVFVKISRIKQTCYTLLSHFIQKRKFYLILKILIPTFLILTRILENESLEKNSHDSIGSSIPQSLLLQ